MFERSIYFDESRAHVQRERVLKLLNASPGAKLVLVSAPAGFGKTTVLTQWRAILQHRKARHAWMTIEDSDNDASRFISRLSSSIKLLDADGPFDESGAGIPDPARLTQLALGVMDQIARQASAFTLFLDDLERINDPAALQLVQELAAHMPQGAQLIIASRRIPELGLGRLRVREQLLEIDAEQLRFTVDETTRYLEQCRHLSMLRDDVQALHKKTEGWIAALTLASAALERRENYKSFIADFSGTHRALTQYLAEDVFASQSPSTRDFMMQTSVLDELREPLCRAVCPAHDVGQTIAHLERANLFIVPIPGQSQVYRYHSLFSSFLRDQLERFNPERIGESHRRAAGWYEANGKFVEAIGHYLQATDFEAASRLMLECVESLLEGGRIQLLSRWFMELPADWIERQPLFAVTRIWVRCFTAGPWGAWDSLQLAQERLQVDPRAHAHVLALRPVLLMMMDKVEEAYPEALKSQAEMPAGHAFANSVLANEMAYIFLVIGDSDRSHAMLDLARARGGVRDFHKMYSESIEGMMDLEEGRWHQATSRFKQAIASTQASQSIATAGDAWAGVLFAGTRYQQNDLVEAEHLLRLYVPLAKDIGLADHLIAGYRMLSRIAYVTGDIDRAFQFVSEMEYVGHHRQIPRIVSSAKLERARILLMQGNRQGSREELERANNREVWERVRGLRLPAHDTEYFELAWLRWMVHSGLAAEALLPLEQEIQSAFSGRRHRRALKLQLLQCLALHETGNRSAAHSAFLDLLQKAWAKGQMRLILDEGWRAAKLLNQCCGNSALGDTPSADGSLPAYVSELQRAFKIEVQVSVDDIEPSSAALPLEPLTTKEMRMLALLAEGYSNPALAEKLFVSTNTVRTHLRHIYEKLDVHNRTQAVTVARRIGLLG